MQKDIIPKSFQDLGTTAQRQDLDIAPKGRRTARGVGEYPPNASLGAEYIDFIRPI